MSTFISCSNFYMSSMSSHGPVQPLEVSVALWAAGRESGADGLSGTPFRCENCRMKLFLGCGFKYFLFSPLPGEMIQFDSYFSKGLVQPPPRFYWWILVSGDLVQSERGPHLPRLQDLGRKLCVSIHSICITQSGSSKVNVKKGI